MESQHASGFRRPRSITSRNPRSATLLRESFTSLSPHMSFQTQTGDGNYISSLSSLPERHIEQTTGRALQNVEARDGYVDVRCKTHSFSRLQEVRDGHKQADNTASKENQSVKNILVNEVAGRPTKLKLKLGGVTHTLHALLPPEKDLRDNSEFHEWPKTGVPSARKRRHRLILQGFSDDEETAILVSEKFREKHTKEKVSDLPNWGLQHELNKSIGQFEGESSPKFCSLNSFVPPSGPPLRKSSRVVKRRVFHLDEDQTSETGRKSRRKLEDEDEFHQDYVDNDKEACLRRGSSIDGAATMDSDERGAQRLVGTMKEPTCWGDAKKKSDILTARQRSLQSCKQGVADSETSLIEFPEGLMPSFSRKQKVNLSEEDRQAKKAEATRRRKQQVEKAAKDVQASAIQKILGQDSVRKKREDRLQKQREQSVQSKKFSEVKPASNSIRWIYGPTGTVVSWSKDVELPMLFNSGPLSYPPPREKCAIPTCNNTYKYRHSKLKLPLCSLQCYQMVETQKDVISAF
ncbi:hypothetical protein O6H91_05G114000 [Diphasiastrum complanatum]|uniref:Uncharacterized protein n=1 Tax=Diphasiastrum complanatum TaxID=34168 RepID=A0ACC2DSD4_DIPCM|nr:hypothetical protein O6H91_05G114000 [Diphasiastrum complanatum]